MRTLFLILVSLTVILIACCAWFEHLEAQSAIALLDNVRKVRPQATLSEVQQALGTPDYTFEAPNFPPWLRTSAVGRVTEGTVLVYLIKRYHPKLLIVHLLPASGVQFVTWEPT